MGWLVQRSQCLPITRYPLLPHPFPPSIPPCRAWPLRIDKPNHARRTPQILGLQTEQVPSPWGPQADNPKSNPNLGLQRVANMRRDGPVPAAERSCAAGVQERLPCPKSEVGAMAPWGAEVTTEPD